MKRILFLLMTGILVWSCNKDTQLSDTTKSPDLITFDQFKSEVTSALQNGKVYDWREQSDLHIFSAGELSDQFYNIGYTIDPSFDMERNIHKVDVKSPEWIKAKNEIFAILSPEIEKGKGRESILPYDDNSVLPQVTVMVKNLETIEALRKSPYVRFVEPIGFSITDYEVATRSLGCSASPNYNIPSADYTTISPNVKRSWSFDEHNVAQAWSSSQGDGVRVCIIDTGSSDDQENLGSDFDTGQSQGRNIMRLSTHYSGSWWWKTLDSPNDQCGHGTRMAGLAGAPRGNDGNSVGVAYKADMMTIRAVSDVFISSSSEKNGVRDALVIAANTTDTKVVSMSLGTPFYSSTVADGVYYAYNRDVLINVAAGTSLTWLSWYGVLFPATMAQTNAITGLKDSNNYQKCATCHDGSAVDFTIIMERDNGDNNRTTISLSMDTDQPGYVGGSSAATATFSGISALVRSKFPNENRSQILNRLKAASEFYPYRNNNFGWGNIDAAQAVQ